MKPHVDQHIAAPFLSSAAEVKTFEPRAGYYLLNARTPCPLLEADPSAVPRRSEGRTVLYPLHGRLIKEISISESLAEVSDMTASRPIASYA